MSAHLPPSGTASSPSAFHRRYLSAVRGPIFARRGVTLRGIEQAQFGPDEHERLAGQALAALAAGRVRPVIGQAFPLLQAADAHPALEPRSAVGPGGSSVVSTAST